MGKITGHRAGVRPYGFTIVELLIVIVVIAILAAISIVAYNGIQQRANTTAVIDAVAKSKRLVEAYVATNNEYPYTTNGDYICITTETTCRRNSAPIAATASFDTTMSTIGNLPRKAPLASNTRGGITYQYDASRTVNGRSAPVILSYYVQGVNSDCGMSVIDSENTTASTASTRYTTGNVGGSGLTMCVVSVGAQ